MSPIPHLISLLKKRTNQINYKKTKTNEWVIDRECHIACTLTRFDLFTKIQDDDEEHQLMLWARGDVRKFRERRQTMEI